MITGTLEQKKRRALKVIKYLQKKFPQARIALRYNNPVQLLVAVILSAQCTDKKVNEVTANLFKKYKTAADFANLNQSQLGKIIHSCGFYRNKSKNILAACKIIQSKFGGRVPQTMPEILTLPGVARKTANVVLGNAYGVVEGIAVDTHMIRMAAVWDLSDEKTPEKIERDLMTLFPKKQWFPLTYRLINHGRAICEAKKPKCAECPLKKLCPSSLV